MEKRQQKTTRCPYCREEVQPDAIKCKHCYSAIARETPTHGGICPYCREKIHPEATKCTHCFSSLLPAAPGPLKLWGIGTSPGPQVYSSRPIDIGISRGGRFHGGLGITWTSTHCTPCTMGQRKCITILHYDECELIGGGRSPLGIETEGYLFCRPESRVIEEWTEKCRPTEFPGESSEVYH